MLGCWNPARAATSLESGLVLHYDFDSAKAPAADRSGNGHDGRITDARWVPSGVKGGAMHLHSPLAQITTDDADMPLGDAPRSFSWWVALDSLRPSYSTEFIFYGCKTYNQMSVVSIDWRLGRDCPAFSQHGGVFLSGRRIDQVGVWHHLVFTYGGNGQYAYYINGERWHGYSEMHGPINTRPGGLFCIGCHSPGESHGLDGFIDEVRVYDRVLSEEEARALFREGATRAGQPAYDPAVPSAAALLPPPASHPTAVAKTSVVVVPESSARAIPPHAADPTPIAFAEAPAILRIGFSNDLEGDRDVTVFMPDETLHVWVTDVDLGPWNPNIQFRLTVSQHDAEGHLLERQAAELVPDDSQSCFHGQLPLARFVPGFIQVDIVGTDQKIDALVLMRSSWLRIIPQ